MVNIQQDTPDTEVYATFDAIVRGRRRDDSRPVNRRIRLVRGSHVKRGPSISDRLKAFGIGVRAGTLATAALLVLAGSVATGRG